VGTKRADLHSHMHRGVAFDRGCPSLIAREQHEPRSGGGPADGFTVSCRMGSDLRRFESLASASVHSPRGPLLPLTCWLLVAISSRRGVHPCRAEGPGCKVLIPALCLGPSVWQRSAASRRGHRPLLPDLGSGAGRGRSPRSWSACIRQARASEPGQVLKRPARPLPRSQTAGIRIGSVDPQATWGVAYARTP
jgi:hypothetical protein